MENGKCLVARVIVGGMIHRFKTLIFFEIWKTLKISISKSRFKQSIYTRSIATTLSYFSTVYVRLEFFLKYSFVSNFEFLRQKLLNVGDEIFEINNISVRHKDIAELQMMLRQLRGTITFTLSPSNKVQSQFFDDISISRLNSNGKHRIDL